MMKCASNSMQNTDARLRDSATKKILLTKEVG